MCGIVMMIERHRPVDERALKDGLARLAHRGPDALGLRIETLSPGAQDATIHLGWGHTRLSILDTDPRANQPFDLGADTLVYNGEIYNYRQLAARHWPGQALRTSGDTEVLLRLLAAYGPYSLSEANGMWAFCWLDRSKRRLVLGRDAYGKKPLFYIQTDERLVIASEIGALLAAAGRTAQAREPALASFLSEGWLFPDPTGNTHLEGVREIRPGHCATLDLDRWTWSERQVWTLPLQAPAPSADALPELLADAVTQRLISDRPVGLLLSGGIDSSLILSVLAATGQLDKVRCFVGEAGKSDDAAYAQACLDTLGLQATTVAMRYDAGGMQDFLAVCKSQEKPFPLIGNVLGLPLLYAGMAGEGVRVALDGTGGDEIFGGYWKRYAGFALHDAAAANDNAWMMRVRDGAMLPEPFQEWLLKNQSESSALPHPAPAREALDAADQVFLEPALAQAIACIIMAKRQSGLGRAVPDRIYAMRAPSLIRWGSDRKSTRLNSSHVSQSRMPSSA